jgi:hypothetical protein
METLSWNGTLLVPIGDGVLELVTLGASWLKYSDPIARAVRDNIAMDKLIAMMVLVFLFILLTFQRALFHSNPFSFRFRAQSAPKTRAL